MSDAPTFFIFFANHLYKVMPPLYFLNSSGLRFLIILCINIYRKTKVTFQQIFDFLNQFVNNVIFNTCSG